MVSALLAALLLSACAPGKDSAGGCDPDAENCCVGALTEATVDGPALHVVGEVDCAPRIVARWSLYLEGVTASSAQGIDTTAPIDLTLSLLPYDLDAGDHTLSLWAVPDLDVDFMEVARTSVTIEPSSGEDTGDTGDSGGPDDSDPTGDTGETGEVDTGPFTVDLVLQSVEADDDSVVPGGDIDAVLTVGNLGNSATLAEARAWWSLDTFLDASDTLLGTLALGDITGGYSVLGEMVLPVPADASPGEHHLLFEVAAADAETDTTNNTAALALTVDGAELEANSFSVAPPFGIAGDPMSLTWRARNTGPVDAAPVVLAFYWSTDDKLDKGDSLLSSWEQDDLTAYGSASATDTLPIPDLPSGFVLFVVDAEDVVAEGDESDNVLSAPVEVDDVDLSAVIDSISDTSLATGAAFEVVVTITNAGSTEASAASVALWLSADGTWDAGDTLVLSQDTSALGPGTSATVGLSAEVPLDAPTGAVTLFAVVDANDVLRERDESNNSDLVDVDVVAPDLVPDINGVSSTTVDAGAPFSVDFLVRNWSAAATADDVEAGLYLSADTTWDSGDTWLGLFTLPPASAYDLGTTTTESATIPSTTPSGAMHLLLVADPFGVLPESDESNNVDDVAFTIR